MNELIDCKNLESVEKLRQQLLTEFETNPDLYHSIDVQRVRSENWQIERFVLDTESDEEGFKQLTRVLKWKKSYGLHDRNDDYFPIEFREIFGHEDYSLDKKGRIVIWNTENKYRKIADISPLIEQFMCHQLETQDREAGPKGWVTVSDSSGAGISNVDMSLNQFRIQLLDNYPKALQNSLNVDMPWILSSVFKIIKNFMNKNIRDFVICVNREELSDYVDRDSIPVCFGGNRLCSIDKLNQKFKPLSDCKHLGLNDKQIDNFYNTYKDLLQK